MVVEPQIPRFYKTYVSPEEKLKYKIFAEKQEKRRLPAVPIGGLPPGFEILIKPSAVGLGSNVSYRYPCKIRKIKASERTRKARTTTAVAAGTAALVGGSVPNKDPGESSETLVESLNLEEIRINN